MGIDILAIFIGSAIRLSAPLLIASTGELISQKTGVINTSVDGMMLSGAFLGIYGAYLTGNPWLGFLIAIIGTIPLALLQAFLSVTLKANQLVTGIGINILVLGATTLMYRKVFFENSAGAAVQSSFGFAKLKLFDPVQFPSLANIFNQSWIVYLGIVLLLAIFLIMKRTALGVSINAVGEEPKTVDQAGMSVTALRYLGVLVSGIMAAIAGSLISLGDIHTFTEGMTNGIGFLALAAIIFGNWGILKTALACVLFGAVSALQYQLPAMHINIPPALLIMLPYVLALFAVAGFMGKQTAPKALTVPYVRH
ncbi:ABC transporter permease [Acinetobacter puyangensis]|uniref:ABC transporter permease n=1 Tax=Acinetobacter puyangensis TaxID=1096779 RepID=UPI003A4D59D7